MSTLTPYPARHGFPPSFHSPFVELAQNLRPSQGHCMATWILLSFSVLLMLAVSLGSSMPRPRTSILS
ncbi:Uncharacterized protein HZ326_3303 [Fusarium oxysporum f. sp. albedinis]|nr:Uncharacterized protein HZ326_3303 [Fusarium oxysporum f. sp. albedinis]